ncbi:hypothetical protein IW138_005199 [Coemansia sp. RSA 986]|nr:hypothetical protein IW138_005199 [Coemansia sp. RSA 986]
MDEFIASVKSDFIPLDAFDESVSGLYIPSYYWFENTSPEKSWTTFMPSDMLCSSFYRALQDFPILAGRFKTDKNSRKYVSVDKNNLNMPVYTDSSWDIDFKQVKDAGFSTRLLPEDFNKACGIPIVSRLTTKSAKLGIFHVRRLKNYSGVLVFASIAHAITDGYGFLMFMNCWAEASRWMQDNPTDTELLQRTFIHDRSIHNGYRLHGTDALDAMALESVASGNAMTRFLSWPSLDKRNYITKSMLESTSFTCCSFHMSSQAIKTFREYVQEYAPHGTRYSINDVLVALITVVIGQAIRKSNAKKQDTFVSKMTCALFGSKDSTLADTLTSVFVNMRARVNTPSVEDFVGNLSLSRHIRCPQALVQGENNLENISKISSEIKNAVAATDAKYAGQLNCMLNSESDMPIRQACYYYKSNNRLTVSNVSKSGYYKTDFGAGIPFLIRPMLCAFPGIIMIMPCHPDMDGYDIIMNLEMDVANIVSRDKQWMDLVESYHLDI